MWRRVFPFLRWWNFIGWDTLRADLLAGLTGAVIVLPQGVAFAMIAGLPPEYGLYTSIVTPIIAALFGSSLHLISGPTTAISIVVFSTISALAEPGSADYIQMVLTLTFLAGVYQLAFGLARLGALVNFVSHSVVVGFTLRGGHTHRHQSDEACAGAVHAPRAIPFCMSGWRSPVGWERSIYSSWPWP